MLWDSGWVNHVWIPATPTLVPFSVPHVVVPDTITWTLEYPTMGAVYLPWFGPPTIGTHITTWWGIHGSWWHEQPDGMLMALIVAEPGPTSVESATWGGLKALFR